MKRASRISHRCTARAKVASLTRVYHLIRVLPAGFKEVICVARESSVSWTGSSLSVLLMHQKIGMATELAIVIAIPNDWTLTIRIALSY